MKRWPIILIFLSVSLTLTGIKMNFRDNNVQATNRGPNFVPANKHHEGTNKTGARTIASASPAFQKRAGNHFHNEMLKNKFKSLKELQECYEEEDSCNFPSEDPREYFLAIGQELKKSLKELYKYVIEQKIVNKTVVDIANNFLQISDGHVKEAALMLLSTQPTEFIDPGVIASNVVDYHDTRLIPLAMDIFSRFEDEDSLRLINNSFKKCMNNGSHYVANKIALLLRPFLNEDNLQEYRHLLDNLPAKSKIRKILQASLEEFELEKGQG